MFSSDYCEIFKNSFFYRTPPLWWLLLHISLLALPCVSSTTEKEVSHQILLLHKPSLSTSLHYMKPSYRSLVFDFAKAEIVSETCSSNFQRSSCFFLENKRQKVLKNNHSQLKIGRPSSLSQNFTRLYFILCVFKPFLVYVPILYPLKTSENQRLLVFSGGIKWDHWSEMG